TGAAVSSYVLRSETGINAGFDFYDDSIPVAAAGAVSEHRRPGFETLKSATPWIDRHASKPFFFFFHIYEPHAPYDPSYDGEIAKSDAIVGKLLARLKQLGVYDRALIIFLSDHGEGLWQHGEDQHGILLYREALQVPLLIKLPRSQQKNTSIAQPVPLTGVFPTILDLLGIQPSERSLLGKTASAPIYSETLYPRIHLGWSELRSLIEDRNHYIDGPRPELYVRAADPGETKDLVASDRRAAATLKANLQKFPSAIAPIERVDPEEAAKLAALGYVGSPQNRTGPLPNPRDVIGSLQQIKEAFALADQHRDDEAIRAFRALLQKNPGLQDVWSKLGETLIESGRYDEAIDSYKSAIAHSARFSPDLALGLGFALLKSGKTSEAIEHAQLALNTNPREAHELIARSLAEEHRYADAEQQAQLAIEAGDQQPTSILLLAEIQRSNGKLQDALQTISIAQRRANTLEVRHLYGIDYLRGDVLARMDRVDEAIAAYKREIDASPEHLQSYANLALIYFIEENRAAGLQTLDEMAEKNPHRGAFALAAKTLDVVGEKEQAARWRVRASR
ncbi:MAG: sulfatase-like hydrolase/transferase, partial [Thermoanaerobaculia bacterium]